MTESTQHFHEANSCIENSKIIETKGAALQVVQNPPLEYIKYIKSILAELCPTVFIYTGKPFHDPRDIRKICHLYPQEINCWYNVIKNSLTTLILPESSNLHSVYCYSGNSSLNVEYEYI